MGDFIHQESPLVQIELGDPGANLPKIAEKPFLGFINLRGKTDNSEFLAGVLAALGCEPPSEANTVVESGNNRIYWLGPDEWLVVTPAGEQAKLLAELQQALDGVFASAVDNSSGLTMLEITGDNAVALLATDCPLDLHVKTFKPGQCAQTRLAKSGMTIAPMREGDGFEVIIRRSFADYLLLWLQNAMIAFKE
jgi:sarcosine oxidase subunit gamma